MGINGRYRACGTCGSLGHYEGSEQCPYKKTQERQDPFGLEKTGTRRKRETSRVFAALDDSVNQNRRFL